MKILNREFAKNKFNELNDLKFDIQQLMSILQNPVPITKEDLIIFKEGKDEIIDKLNDIFMELEIEYDKR